MIMPVKGGKDTFREMKKINPMIVTLLVSGYSIDREANRIMQEGVKGFIQKSYRKREFAKKIVELLPANTLVFQNNGES